MSDSVSDNPEKSRFELEAEGHLAVANYRRRGDTIIFTHTEVPKELAGKGIGSRLAQGALELARAQKLRVVAQCPFIASYVAKHPEFGDLLR